MRTDRHFLVGTNARAIRPIGTGISSSSLSNIKRAILPISVTRKPLGHHVGFGRVGGRGTLLLSDGLGTSDIQGSGYGVRTPKPELLDKLQNLSLRSIQGKLPRKKNVSITF